MYIYAHINNNNFIFYYKTPGKKKINIALYFTNKKHTYYIP